MRCWVGEARHSWHLPHIVAEHSNRVSLEYLGLVDGLLALHVVQVQLVELCREILNEGMVHFFTYI